MSGKGTVDALFDEKIMKGIERRRKACTCVLLI